MKVIASAMPGIREHVDNGLLCTPNLQRPSTFFKVFEPFLITCCMNFRIFLSISYISSKNNKILILHIKENCTICDVFLLPVKVYFLSGPKKESPAIAKLLERQLDPILINHWDRL